MVSTKTADNSNNDANGKAANVVRTPNNVDVSSSHKHKPSASSALENGLATGCTTKNNQTITHTAGEGTSRRKRMWLAGCIVVLSAVVGVVIYFYFTGGAPTTKLPTPAPYPVAIESTPATSRRTTSTSDTVFLWSSTGGGWRAQLACVGFANLFQKAGLLGADSSLLHSVATNSGGSWFNSLLFFSPEFYQQVVLAETPDDIYDFTITWMNSYYEYALNSTTIADDLAAAFGNITNQTVNEDESFPEEELVDLGPSTIEQELEALQDPQTADLAQLEYNAIQLFVQFFDLIVAANASWAHFMEDTMSAGVDSMGADGAAFLTTVASPEARHPALQNTEAIFQSTLSPVSKIRLASASNLTELAYQYIDANLTEEWAHLLPILGDIENQDLVVYLGPFDPTANETSRGEWNLSTQAIPAYYVVNSTFAGFQYGACESSCDALSAYAAPTSPFFKWDDWFSHYLYENQNFWDWPTPEAPPMVSADLPAQFNVMAVNMTPAGTFRAPFGGGAITALQAAAISSAAAGPVSPAQPGLFSQTLSKLRDQIRHMTTSPIAQIGALSAFDIAAEVLFNNPLADSASVCSQWPAPCGPSDGQFVDGAFTDNPAVAANIASYQRSADANLSQTIHLVVTNTNSAFENNTYDLQQYLQYYNTHFNEGVEPGGYVWLPGFLSPYTSPQIFAESLQDEDMLNAVEEIDGSNLTTLRLSGTTIDNPAYGVRAGQTVEILMLNINAVRVVWCLF